MVLLAKSICDHQSDDISLLLFRQGDVIHVMEQRDTGWWDGICHGRRGWFPSHFVIFLTEEELKAVEAQIPEWLNTEESELIKGIKDLRFAEKKIPNEQASNSAKSDTNQEAKAPKKELDTRKFSKENDPNINGELSNDHTNGLGKTSDYKKNHNRTNSNIDSGISVTDDIGMDHLSMESIGDQLNESDWYLKQREALLSNLYREATPNKFVDCQETLPLFWVYKQDDDQSKYYINLLSQDCTRAAPSPDPIFNSMFGPTRPISPVSSEDTEDTESASNLELPNAEALARRNRKPSNFMTKLANSRSGSGDLSVATTWDTISSELTLALYSLNSSIKRKLKWDYMYHTHVSVHRIKNILKIIELANLSNKDIQADDNATIASSEVSESGDQSSVKFQSNPIISFKDEKLKTLYNDILKQLTQLILYARSASSVWPTPEAGNDLLSVSEKTLALSKSIISRAQELKIQADNPIDDMPDTMNLINMKFETEDQSCELLYKVSSMASEVSYLVTQTRRLITDYPEITLKTSKRLILSVGEILAVVNGFTVNDCNEHLASIFNSDKSRAFEEVGNFVVSLQTKSIHNLPGSQSKNNPSYKSLLTELNQNVLATAARLETAIYRLIISGKILIDDRDQYEQFLLKKEINRFLGNLDSGRPFLGSEKIMNLLDFKPRRPMSMTFHHIPLVSPSIITPFDLEGSSIESNQNIQRSLSTPANSNADQTLTSLSGSSTLDPGLAPVIAGRHSSSRSVASSISSMTENFEDVQLPSSVPAIRTNSIRKLEETPWFLKPDYDPDHIVIVDNVVKGGTLNALIERLTSHDHLDTSFIMTFLLTYRTFTNTVEFLDLLFRRYSLTCPIGLQPDDQELWREKKLKPVRLRVFSVLKTWLESFYLEEEDSRGLENLRHFASTTMSESNTASAGVLMKLVRKRKESSDGQFRKMVRSLREAPTPILPKNLSKFKLLDLDPLEIARQLTIVDSRLYNDLKPVEFLNKAWSRKDNISSPNVTRLIERFNQVNYWVAESILTQHDAKKRCTVIRRFISVAEACAHLNNFSGVMAILAGFNMAPVFRLKRTWDLIAGKPLITLETLKKTMDSSKNFAEYRELLHSVNPPCVPFLGVYLTDLTFNEDGNPNYMPKLPHLINFGKQAKTAEIIREIQGYQNSHYNLDAVAEVQDYLTDQISKAKNLAQLYELSLQMEPKEREDEKIARLLHESGFL